MTQQSDLDIVREFIIWAADQTGVGDSDALEALQRIRASTLAIKENDVEIITKALKAERKQGMMDASFMALSKENIFMKEMKMPCCIETQHKISWAVREAANKIGEV
jgi:type IV secretory pathway VirJ component